MTHVEEFIDSHAAAQLMGVSVKTFRRYAEGHYGVKLRTENIAGRRRPVTTKKWISKFIKELSEVKSQ